LVNESLLFFSGFFSLSYNLMLVHFLHGAWGVRDYPKTLEEFKHTALGLNFQRPIADWYVEMLDTFISEGVATTVTSIKLREWLPLIATQKLTVYYYFPRF